MEQFTLTTADGARLGAYKALPDGPAKGVVQLAHGMAEHLGRYERLARALTAAGYAVYGADHRGHGRSADVHGLGGFGPGGFQSVVDDMAAVSALARREQPGAPLVLLGHSMGSFASQLYILQYADNLSALVLSGTAAMDQLLANGPPGGLEAFNAGFEPARTGFEWLSRDEAEVDAYVADPLCGFALDEGAMQTMFGLGVGARGDPRLANVPKDLPVYVISGEVDPVVGPGQAFARALIDSYAAAGLTRIDHRVYPGGRHEMFNETCRDQVEADMVAWLDRALG
jgi:alpha-beta hydrolase superfamily lysophospholipase